MSTENTNINATLTVNRERSHGRTLSVPSISTSEHNFSGRSPSPGPSAPSSRTETSPQPSSNMYLTPNADGMSQWSSGFRPGSSGNGVRSRSASTSSLSTPIAGQVPKKKVVTACQRCRMRKIKCDGVLPCCGNCAKAGQVCMEVDKSGERDIPRSHVLELENRIKYLENVLAQNCPNIDLDSTGPPVELRSRPTPPAIRIVTSGPSLNPPPPGSSIASSSPISAVSTPASFDFSPGPGGSLMPPYSPAFSPFSFSEPPGSAMPSPMLSPRSPFLGLDYGIGPGAFHNPGMSEGRKGSFMSVRSDTGSIMGNIVAQDVGLVALSLTEDSSRYIGASSGCEFARMMFADCPPQDSTAFTTVKEEEDLDLRRRSSGSAGGLSSNSSTKGDSGSITPSPSNVQPKSRRSSAAVGESPDRKRGRWTDAKKPSPLPSVEDAHIFTSMFFDNVYPHYPFMERNTFEACREVVYSSEKGVSATFNTLRRTSSIPILPPNYTLPLARFHVFMVFAVGTSILSAQQGHRPSADSDGYFISAMGHVENDEVKLRGSLQGLQNLLLIAMYALHVDGGGGMSIWHLNSTVVAGCIELGLHKNSVVAMTGSGRVGPAGTDSALVALKRKVFWSIYALDRNLGIMLGRPFALDENECDVELPDTLLDDRAGSGFMDRLSGQGGHSPGGVHSDEGGDGPLGTSSFPGTVYLLQMTRITSIIKSTLYRISPVKPAGYPTPYWLQNLPVASQHNTNISDIVEWQKVIQRYLNEIRQLAKARLTLAHSSSATYAVSQAIELKYHEAIQLLYRPNPVLPQPALQNASTCLTSTMEMIRTYAKLRKNGGINHAWLSAQWVFLSGLSMVWSFKTIWPILQRTPGQREQKLENLKEDIKTCSGLLEEFGTRWKVMLRAKERFDNVAKVTLDSLTSQPVASQSSPNSVSNLGLTSGGNQLFGTGQQFSSKRPPPRIIIAPQRNLLVDLENSQLHGTGSFQLQNQEHQRLLLQLQQQQAFNNVEGNSLFGADNINSHYGFGTLYNDQSSQISSLQQANLPLSSSPVDSALLNQPLLIPIIRQSPTPTSETPTPLNPHPTVDNGEWFLGSSLEMNSSNLQQQSNDQGGLNGVGDMDLSWIDMDWTPPDLGGYNLDGTVGVGETGLGIDGLGTGDGGDGGGDDSKMWGIGDGNIGR